MFIENYLTRDNIIDSLCKRRAKVAIQRSKYEFYARMSRKKKNRFRDPYFMSLFPPRRVWRRPKKRETLSPVLLISDTLKRTIYYFDKNPDLAKNEIWYWKLQEVVSEIIDYGLNFDSSVIPILDFIPLPKDKEETLFRAITSFGFKQQILLSLCNKYITDYFDDLFSNCSYAFRSKKNSKEKNRNQAIIKIIDFLKANQGRNIYIAESDITGFYDTICHDVTKNTFEKYLKEAALLNVAFDRKAEQIFMAYLNSYDFYENVKNRETQILEGHGYKSGEIKCIPLDQLKKLHFGNGSLKVGVPQGGALSCFIANLVLNEIDRFMIEKYDADSSMIYLRYCDDMILVSVDKDKIENAFDDYNSSLKKVKLMAQGECVPELPYSSAFWKIKNSKRPYLWGDKHKNGIPWLSFLGYQIKYDGTLRVRKSSIIKEISKQAKICTELIQVFKKKGKFVPEKMAIIKGRRIVFRLRKKLIAMAIGKNDKNGNDFSWVNGFSLLKMYDSDLKDIKLLDKHRKKQISRIKKLFKKIQINERKRGVAIDLGSIDGYKHSYYRQFLKEENFNN